MENKKLKTFKYYSGGGFIDERGVRGVTFEMFMTENDAYCSCSLSVGDLRITKNFDSKNYPKILDMCKLLNKVDFSKISTDVNMLMTTDIGEVEIEYKYNVDKEIKKIEYPNHKGLKKLINSFITNYLLKDKEFVAIFNSLIESNPEIDYAYFKTIINNSTEFDEKADYGLDVYESPKSNLDVYESVKHNIDMPKYKNKDIALDDLLSTIDDKLADLDKQKSNDN